MNDVCPKFWLLALTRWLVDCCLFIDAIHFVIVGERGRGDKAKIDMGVLLSVDFAGLNACARALMFLFIYLVIPIYFSLKENKRGWSNGMKWASPRRRMDIRF